MTNVKNSLKCVAKKILNMFEPIVRLFTDFYGIEMRRGYRVYGQHPLTIEHDKESAERFISKTAYFNTRSGSIFIGRNTLIAKEVMFLTGKHLNVAEAEASGLPIHHVPEEGRDIQVGRHCFIGSRAIITGPVKVGDYAVVAAGAVVTRDVPERTIVAGVPAKEIKHL